MGSVPVALVKRHGPIVLSSQFTQLPSAVLHANGSGVVVGAVVAADWVADADGSGWVADADGSGWGWVADADGSGWVADADGSGWVASGGSQCVFSIHTCCTPA